MLQSGVRVIAIVLAAGEGRRMGGPKALLRIEDTTFLARVAALLRRPGVEAVVAVLGHEACGTVVEAGSDVTDLAEGDRVILLWITPCGTCIHCGRGEAHLCVNGSARASEPYAIDSDGSPVYPGLTVGSFAEQTVVPATATARRKT